MFRKFKEAFEEHTVKRSVVFFLIALAFISATGVIYAVTDSKSHAIWIVTAVVYAALAAVYFSLNKLITKTGEVIESDSFLGSMTLDLIVKMPSPVVICNSNDIIIWTNGAFSSKFSKMSITGQSFDGFSGVSLSEIKNNSAESGIAVSLDDKVYSVRCYPVSSKSKKYFLTLWEDRTELQSTVKTLNDEDTTVAYVMADNLDEIAQYAKDSTRAAANEIEKLLTEWALESGGILKEYQNGRYLFLFRAAEMSGFIDKKFDILDRIREVRVGESSLSVTVSMGISRMPGTLAEKERVAAEALDMALQRGGDQVVVKTPKGLEFFGGKTQTVQKRTKVRARVIANELASMISKSTNVMIMGHRAADFDCIGACLGIARIASYCGVEFHIICNKNDPNFIRCYDRIKHLDDYSGESVFVSASEAEDLMGSDTLTVIVDVNNKFQLEAPSIAEISHRTIYIDHHRKTAEFDEAPLISYIEPSASSACELVSEILEQALNSGTLLKEEADIMYAGILLDTKQFTKNAGVRTFGAALYLRGEGANPTDALTLFKSCLSDFISEAKFESNVVVYRKHMAISCNDDPNNDQSDRIAAAKAADKLLSVEGVKASFALCRIDDKIHISARSSGEVNVQLILEKLEGGGHFDAAATQLTTEMDKALVRLKGAIDEYIEENKAKA